MKRPASVWALISLLCFLGLGGLYGGVLMIMDPSGHLIQMHTVLHLLLVPNFFLPGIFLLVVMGITPLFLIYALLRLSDWPSLQAKIGYQNYHWAWFSCLCLGMVLCGWLMLQGLLIGFHWPIQFIIAGTDVFILILVMTPSLKHYAQSNQIE